MKRRAGRDEGLNLNPYWAKVSRGSNANELLTAILRQLGYLTLWAAVIAIGVFLLAVDAVVSA
jgi:hypothetical protein